jgi:hypothetical protein
MKRAPGRPQALLAGIACASLLGGCGGSGPARDPAQEARVVSEINASCTKARLQKLLFELRSTAAYLPAGRDFNEARAVRSALLREHSKRSSDFNRRFDRLQLRIYRDMLSLGITCAGLHEEIALLTPRVAGKSNRPK